LFAGGGTGGHIFPSVAVVERLAEMKSGLRPLFLVSDRKLDGEILTKANLPFEPLPAKPFVKNPLKWLSIYQAHQASQVVVKKLIEAHEAVAVVAMGGFVCPPAVIAAEKAGIPVLLVNLDAVPGKANKMLATHANQIFSAYQVTDFPVSQVIGVPMRRSAVGPSDKAKAREALGLLPDRETLLVTGASQGAKSINVMMMEMIQQAQARKALAAWQVVHLCGGSPQDARELQEAYDKAAIPARVDAFTTQMGVNWAAATIAISRAGAGSVAEAWANTIPTIFLPYPYHADEHQRHNAKPLEKMGSGLIYKDLIDGKANARQLSNPLMALMANSQRRSNMIKLMQERMPPDGAKVVAKWLIELK
jgi:UDP-N-acetylglucosamine--N-acetylmuramyl-(pentapeptide) pyrophosphoryl-undecaprenol N-acetylglucosamine transferase